MFQECWRKGNELIKNLRRQWEPLSTLIKEKEPLWCRLPSNETSTKDETVK